MKVELLQSDKIASIYCRFEQLRRIVQGRQKIQNDRENQIGEIILSILVRYQPFHQLYRGTITLCKLSDSLQRMCDKSTEDNNQQEI